MKRLFILLVCILGGSAYADCYNQPSDTYLYYKLGGGVTSTSDDVNGAIAGGLGVRHRGRLGWEIGLSSMASIYDSEGLALLRGLALFYTTPKCPSSFYLGVGLAGGFRNHDSRKDLAGLFAEFTAGREWLFHVRKRGLVKGEKGCHYETIGLPLRFFIEINVHQPALVSRSGYGYDVSLAPAVALEVGIGI